jgi:hypothetical protein
MARQKKQVSSLIYLAYVVLALVVIGGGAYYVLSDTPPKFDKETLCPIENSSIKVSGLNVILIDRTDAVTEVQAIDIKTNLSKLIKESLPYEKFVIYEITGSSHLTNIPKFLVCNPGGNNNESFSQKMSSTPITKRIFEERFQNRLNEMLSSMLNIDTQVDSPIIELIQAVVVQDLKYVAPEIPKRLILVSDMMQHSKSYSQYRGLNEKEFFQSDYFNSVAVDLTGVDVRILYIQRTNEKNSQPLGHVQFWATYFSMLGSKSFTLQPIQGAVWGK